MHMQCLYIGAMRKTSLSLRHLARPGAFDGQAGARRRLLAVPLVGLLTAAALLVAPALASADTSSTLTVVGTSDVSDSGLIPNLIQPAVQQGVPAVHVQVRGLGDRRGDPERRERNRRTERADRARRLAGEPVRRRAASRTTTSTGTRSSPTTSCSPARPAIPRAWPRTARTTSRRRSRTSRRPGRTGKATFYTRGGTTTASGYDRRGARDLGARQQLRSAARRA